MHFQSSYEKFFLMLYLSHFDSSLKGVALFRQTFTNEVKFLEVRLFEAERRKGVMIHVHI